MTLGRRQFLLCAAGAGLGFRVYAKQPETLRTIGMLAQDLQPGLLDAFRDELQKIGYVEGTDIKIDVRDASEMRLARTIGFRSSHRNC